MPAGVVDRVVDEDEDELDAAVAVAVNAAGLYGFRESVNCPFEKAPLQVFEPEYVPVIVLPFI